MHILENVGLRFLDDEALTLWEQAGAKVSRAEQHVWLDRGLVMNLVQHAPRRFIWRARNPERNIKIGENALAFFPNAGMVNVSNVKVGRRPGLQADAIDLFKLVQQCNILHFAGVQHVAMHDVPISERHLRVQLNGLTLSDKAAQAVSHGRIIVNDALEMAKLVFGDDLVTGGPVTGGNINVNSPLVYDDRMLGGLIAFARAGQVNIITPFILAGAMSPVTIPGAVAQQNAEALAGIALTQLVRPGAPVIYGGFTTNVDMKSGSPAFGTPEGAWALLLGAQLARHYDLPYRGSGSLNTANTVDAQAALESLWTLWPAIQAHTNVIIHAVGWLEGGLTVSYEKFIIDVENLARMQHFLQGVDWEGDVFALEAIAEVGPGGHHFATTHTQARYQSAFYDSLLSDRSNFDAWRAAGEPDIVQRAAESWQTLLKTYTLPPLAEGVREALEDYVARRSQELAGVNLYD